VVCNEEDTDGRARVTADEERVLISACRLNGDQIMRKYNSQVGWL